jgi:hypothetical protein
MGTRAEPSNVNTAGDYGDQEKAQAALVLSSGDPEKEQKTFPPIDKDPRSQWDFRIGTNGVIEHFRTADRNVAVRETGDKNEIVDQDHDSLELSWSGLLSASAVTSISMEIRSELEPWLICGYA